MSNILQKQDLENGRYGNYYDDVIFNLPVDAAFSLQGAEIVMQVKLFSSGPVLAEYSTTNNKIEIVTDHQFKLLGHVVTIPPHQCVYDILIVFAGDRPYTDIGGTWIIERSITQVS